MALREEILPYTDGNNLVACNPVTPGTLKGSDNGPMFCSEYYIMLQKSDQLTDQDKSDFQNRIGQCVDSNGMLCRVPASQPHGQDQVDDYYAVLNGCMQLGNMIIPRQFLKALIKNFGFMDNINPGSHSNWASFMPRQIQLMACVIAASFPSWKNPLHILLRMLFIPSFIFASMVIATSCWGSPLSDTDARRLSWHLWQCVSKVSPLSWLASRIWLKRLYKAYGPTGMKAVAAIYYVPHPDNPFSKYWITE